MPSANDLLHDAAISRAVDVALYVGGLVRRVIGLLNRSDSELFSRLSTALERYDATSYSVQRLDAVLHDVRLLNSSIYENIGAALTGDVRAFAELEIDFQLGLLKRIPALALPVTPVAVDQVYAAAIARPFQGRLLEEWASDIGESRMRRISDAVRIGFSTGETVGEMVRRIRGTKARNYADGVIEIDRRHAEAVVRTAVSHVASYTRQQVADANADLVKAVQWVSTLDTRTSEICRVRDGLQYTPDSHKPVGHKMPWLGGPGQAHWNCRSTSCMVLKSAEELGMDADITLSKGRASMDGQVPEGTTYAEWFAKQSAARQDEIVGPTRGQLFRSGKVTFDRFTDTAGRWLTLKQLRERSQL